MLIWTSELSQGWSLLISFFLNDGSNFPDLHTSNSFGFYPQHCDCYVVETRDSALFVFLSRQLLLLDSNCKFFLLGSSSNLSSLLCSLTRLLTACPRHAWMNGYTKIWVEILHRIWDFPSLALSFIGFPFTFQWLNSVLFFKPKSAGFLAEV